VPHEERTGDLEWRNCFDCGEELILHPGEDCSFCGGWTYADDLYFALWPDGESVFEIIAPGDESRPAAP
jgi:hypothetical protein